MKCFHHLTMTLVVVLFLKIAQVALKTLLYEEKKQLEIFYTIIIIIENKMFPPLKNQIYRKEIWIFICLNNSINFWLFINLSYASIIEAISFSDENISLNHDSYVYGADVIHKRWMISPFRSDTAYLNTKLIG